MIARKEKKRKKKEKENKMRRGQELLGVTEIHNTETLTKCNIQPSHSRCYSLCCSIE